MPFRPASIIACTSGKLLIIACISVISASSNLMNNACTFGIASNHCLHMWQASNYCLLIQQDSNYCLHTRKLLIIAWPSSKLLIIACPSGKLLSIACISVISASSKVINNACTFGIASHHRLHMRQASIYCLLIHQDSNYLLHIRKLLIIACPSASF